MSAARTDPPAARSPGRERRTGTRFRTRALTDGKIVGEPKQIAQSFLGTTVNVSAGGALVRTYEALSAGQEVSLTMHLPEGDLSVQGTVLHVEQDAVGCRLAGVRFAPLGDLPASVLSRHLRAFESPPRAAWSGPAEPESASHGRAPETPSASGESAAASPPPDPTPAVGDSPLRRKSLRDLRQKTTVVFPFEGAIHRG